MRGICPKCKESYEVEQDWIIKLGVPPNQLQARDGKVSLHKGKGCDNCAGTGYRGRQGLYEVMPITPELRELILDRASTTDLRRMAVQQGMLTLREDGLVKVRKGVTTIEEILRETAVTD